MVPQNHKRFSEATQDVTYPRPARWRRGGEKKTRQSEICNIHCEMLIQFTHLYSSSMSDMAEMKTREPAVNDTEQFFVRKDHFGVDEKLLNKALFNESVSTEFRLATNLVI